MRYLKQYGKFINEDVNLANSLLKKKMADFDKLKTLLAKNIGYFGKFTEYLLHENVPYSELEKLYQELLDLKSKSVSLNIMNYKYEKLTDAIIEANKDLSINSLISRFPKQQKELAKELLKDGDDYKQVFLQASKKDNIDNFVSKVSRYKDSRELLNALEVFSKDSKNQREEVIEIVKGLKDSNLVYQNDNILIVQVETQNDIKVLGSDTSWCIVNSEYNWNNYTKGRYQYIVYDYTKDESDPDFKIGFTLSKNASIYTAHNILDNHRVDVLKELLDANKVQLVSLLPKRANTVIDFNKINSKTTNIAIQNMIDNCGNEQIPAFINKVMSLDKSDHVIGGFVKSLVTNYFVGREYILEKELLDINKNIMMYLSSTSIRRKVITSTFDEHLDEDVFAKALDIWSDKTIVSMTDYSGYVSIDDYDSVILNKFADRLNSIYDKLTYDDIEPFMSNKTKKLIKPTKGYKLSQVFEITMLVLNKQLGRTTKDYDLILKHSSNDILEYFAAQLKMPIDLDSSKRHYNISDWMIPLIIQKDYKNPIAITQYTTSNVINDLITRLDGHKFTLKVFRDHFKKIEARNTNPRLAALFKKINIKKRFEGEYIEVSDEKGLTLRVNI